MNPVLLVGTDYEGDSRQIECDSLDEALDLAAQCVTPPFAWRGWEVWGNAPDWQPLAVSI